MLNLKIITVGSLKESYLKDAVAEYTKRLSAFCNAEIVELKEYKLPDNPSQSEIAKALSEEAERISKAIPQKAYKIALCVEGKQLSSEELAAKIEEISQICGTVCLIIGSSHGISEALKASCDYKLSVSKLTFPHQLMRVMLLEIIYRAMNIIKGTKYHK
ncbi:MAG: 23S rRNA (pseudouridine(1915)-N(3))-methyltransferase RlmH [Clostridia bacterium]|nr:23S rRNA (pseudouridine(1915)-N(3))-methyltransferase RlmH [Clostridia bacterium]